MENVQFISRIKLVSMITEIKRKIGTLPIIFGPSRFNEVSFETSERTDYSFERTDRGDSRVFTDETVVIAIFLSCYYNNFKTDMTPPRYDKIDVRE